MTQVQQVTVSLDDLIEDAQNPNSMSAEEFAGLVRSVREVGMVQPILVTKEANGAPGSFWRIVDGHHRVRAAREVGLSSVSAVIWDGTPQMRRALGVIMNRFRGSLDYGRVAEIASSLFEEGWSAEHLTLLGYTADEVDTLLSVSADVDADEVLKNTPMTVDEELEPSPGRPLVLELTFKTKTDLQRARRALKRAAGKRGALGDGLLVLINANES